MILIGRGLDLKARVDVLSGQLPVQFSRCVGLKEVRRAKSVRLSEKRSGQRKASAKPAEESESEGRQGSRESGCESAKPKSLDVQ